MLRARCLARAFRPSVLAGQRIVISSQVRMSALRFQSTSPAVTEASVGEIVKDSRKVRNEQREERKLKFEEAVTKFIQEFDSEIAQGKSSKSLYQSFFKNLEEIPRLKEFSYRARFLFTKTINTIIQKSINEIADPNQVELPVTPQDVLNKAIQYKVASLPSFNLVGANLLKTGESKDILPLWVSFLEYAADRGISSTPEVLRNLTLLAYVECTLGSPPNLEVIKKFLQIEELSNIGIISTFADKFIPKGSQRSKALQGGINKLFYTSRNPNSLDLLQKAQKAGQRADSHGVDLVLRELRKISDLSSTPITEQTLVAFMKIYNPIKHGESIKLFNEIIKSGIAPSTSAWNTLIDTVSRIPGPLKTQLQQIEAVRQKISTPNDETTARLIESYTRIGAFREVESLATEKNLESSIIAQAYIQSLALQKNFTKLSSFSKKLESKNITLTQATYNKLLGAFAKENKFTEAQEILSEMDSKNISPDISTFTIIFDLTLKSFKQRGLTVDVQTINEFFGQLRTVGIEPSVQTFNVIIDNLGKEASTLSSAQDLFEVLKTQNLTSPVSYISLISNEFKLGKPEAAEAHFAEYAQSGARISPSNWSVIFEGWSTNGNIEKAKTYLKALKGSSYYTADTLNKFSYHFLLQLADKKRDIQFANEIFELITENKALGSILPRTIYSSIAGLQKKGANVPTELASKL